MTYPVLYALTVFICYTNGDPCVTNELYYYEDEGECLSDLEYLHGLNVKNKDELFAELSCERK